MLRHRRKAFNAWIELLAEQAGEMLKMKRAAQLMLGGQVARAFQHWLAQNESGAQGQSVEEGQSPRLVRRRRPHSTWRRPRHRKRNNKNAKTQRQRPLKRLHCPTTGNRQTRLWR